ncbi:MAG: PorT family protein [Proteiniphilum sp.]|jgi:hypothetical protein|nr:PorT family protein [Proteiniphilum sp.]
MKRMKLSLIAAMLILVTAVSAQVNLGVKGGVNMSNFYGDELTDKNVKAGFHIGLTADYEFMYNSAIQTGLFFTTKGFKSENEGWGNAKYTENLMYLQLPVHYAYKLDVTPGTRIVFHAGPYAAYGVGGSRKASIGNISGEWDVDKIFGDSNTQYNPFDAGLGLGVGAEFGPISVDLGWDMGLVNISRTNNGNIKNQNAYLSVGYKF